MGYPTASRAVHVLKEKSCNPDRPATTSDWVEMAVDTRPQKVEPRSPSSPTELVEGYFMDVYSACFRVLGRPQDAEDATQETFLTLFRTRDKLAAAQSLRAWVLTIARNTSISMLRARRPAASLPDSVADAPPIRSPGDPERLDRAMAALSE